MVSFLEKNTGLNAAKLTEIRGRRLLRSQAPVNIQRD
jgi:hypothetical protein